MDKEYTPAEAKAWLAGYDAGKAFAKKEWVGLSDEEIEDLWGEPVDLMYSGHYNAIRAIEAKLKEKNA